jgi:hypothetical protein
MDARDLFLANNDLVRIQLRRICSDLTDEQVVYEHDAVDERGIGNIVAHLYGSVLNRTSAILGVEPDPAREIPRTSADLMEFIEFAYKEANARIGGISTEQLEATIMLRSGREMTGGNAMVEGFAHAFRHIGNILDARHLGGFETHALG